MTDLNLFQTQRKPSPEDPLRILVSACLTGITCGYDGTANGTYPSVLRLLSLPTARLIRFCPEEYAFGSPREMCDLHGGSGMDVWEGKARVLSESGIDWTDGLKAASEKMLEVARTHEVEIAVMMDVSAACGSQVVYSGSRFNPNKVYQIGAGVSAALLIRNGFNVISQRDYASLERLYALLDPTHVMDTAAIDHHQTAWYRTYFQ